MSDTCHIHSIDYPSHGRCPKCKAERDHPKRGESQKPRFTLIPPVALTLVAATMTQGAEKYREPDGADFWRKRPAREHLAAAMRHLYAHLMGQRLDSDSELPHLAHAAARLLMACEVDATKEG